MSRELKRVPLDFSWPNDMIWNGYVNPYRAQKCTPCDGHGYNPETHKIAEDYWGVPWSDAITQDEVDALIAKGRLWDFYRRVGPNGWEDIEPRPVVTAAAVNAAERSGRGLGHDAINRWILIETRARRLGVFGLCAVCGGDGYVWFSPEIRRLHGEWKRVDPPRGDGYQLWTTSNEGAPISPVFATLDALCAWCETNATTFARFRATAAEWKRMLDGGVVAHTEGNMVFL